MTNSFIWLAGRLIVNGFFFRYLKFLGRPALPRAVSLEVTQRCVARCIMCNIWKHPETKTDLSADQWLAFLASPLFKEVRELDITGGEPFLRPDLEGLISGVCRLRRKYLPELQSIAITTNGLLTGQVLKSTSAMLEMAGRENLHLVIVCAVDAADQTHDRIRNHPGAWGKVSRTIEDLKHLRERHPNLILGLKTTIVPQNVLKLQAICDYARDQDLFTIISPCIITGGRYLNADRASSLAFNHDEVERMEDFYGNVPQAWGFHADAMARFLTGRRRKKVCSVGFNYFFVRSNGDMMLCPLIDHAVGNITQESARAIYHSPKAVRFRRRVGDFPECRRCTEPGLERYALTFEGLGLLAYGLRYGPTKFFQVYRHMGLDKLL